MINRQRKRAENIIRCRKNVEVLHLIKAEKNKIDKIRIEIGFTSSPEFIRYQDDKIYVLDGISKNQAMKIELEALMLAVQKAQISFNEYHSRLDALLNQINAIKY